MPAYVDRFRRAFNEKEKMWRLNIEECEDVLLKKFSEILPIIKMLIDNITSNITF